LVDHLPPAAVVDDVVDDVVVGEVVGSALEMGLKSDEKYWISFCSKFSSSRSTINMSHFECIISSLYDFS
jgi:hypothetical protein